MVRHCPVMRALVAPDQLPLLPGGGGLDSGLRIGERVCLADGRLGQVEERPYNFHSLPLCMRCLSMPETGGYGRLLPSTHYPAGRRCGWIGRGSAGPAASGERERPATFTAFPCAPTASHCLSLP